ncbi:hypothetical protein ADUPG1_007539, partial [Aduncisulcus paluster]
EAEIAVRNTLRRKVQEHVSFRNDLVHADWSIGWVNDDTDEDLPASAHKIKTKDGVPTMSELGITTNEIISRINDLQGLYRQVNVFGTACRARQRGEGRVSDVLEAVPASAGGGTVHRKLVQHNRVHSDFGIAWRIAFASDIQLLQAGITSRGSKLEGNAKNDRADLIVCMFTSAAETLRAVASR